MVFISAVERRIASNAQYIIKYILSTQVHSTLFEAVEGIYPEELYKKDKNFDSH